MPLSKDYVTVRERLVKAQPDIQSVVVSRLEMLSGVQGVITVSVMLKDGRTAEGTAGFRLDLQGKSAQATSPLEDCETSALGRALQWLGYFSDKPSLEEMERAKAAAAAADELDALRSQLLDLAGAIESSGHQITNGEKKLLDQITTLPADRLRNGVRHFETLLEQLPKQ